jgi:ERF superfamily
MAMNILAAAFLNAKKAFAPALKTSTNPHFKSKYADLAACLEAVNDAFLASGITLYQETFECDTGVLVETVLLHESGESLRCGKLHVPASKQDAQGYGSALSYARRYSLMAACGIAPEDDDGNAASKKPRQDSGSPGAIIFSELQPDIQNHLRKAAPQIDAAMPNTNRVRQLIEMVIDNWPDADPQHVKVGLWSLLDSKTRSALKADH